MVDGVPICELSSNSYVHKYLPGRNYIKKPLLYSVCKKTKTKKKDGFPTQNLSQYWSFVQAPASSCKFLDCLYPVFLRLPVGSKWYLCQHVGISLPLNCLNWLRKEEKQKNFLIMNSWIAAFTPQTSPHLSMAHTPFSTSLSCLYTSTTHCFILCC